MKRTSVPASVYVALGALAVVLGSGSVVLNSVGWYYSQHTLSLLNQTAIVALVSQFYFAQGLATVSLVVGMYLLYRALTRSRAAAPESLLSILSDALASKRGMRIGVLTAVAYGLVYALISGVVVYQPGVDFRLAYGVMGTGWSAAACCGALGTVPTLVLYLAPQAHLAVQVVPLNALFALVVPILVGLDTTVAAYAVGRRQVRTGGKWLSSIGVVVGLFTGCPTCAGLFLAGSVGGLGATTLAVALAPYQLLFVSVSIPLLTVSPVVMAATVRRASCAIKEFSPQPRGRPQRLT